MTVNQWTDRDRRELARLLARYGRRAVVEAVQTIPPARRAGHQRDDEMRGALLDDLDWIERRAETLRSRGDSLALQSAIASRFTMTRPREEWSDAVALKKFEKRIKNARAEFARAERIHDGSRARRSRKSD